MDVTSSTGATGSAATKKNTGSGSTESGTSAAGVAGDFQTFLTLLTTQMKNQDPLQPMDSTEFVSQLASFSAVEQQVRANDRLQNILDVLSGGNSAGLAQWIGRDVKVAAKADFSGQPVEVGVEPAEGADTAVLVVKNDFGSEVARLKVAPDATDVTWDGKDATGATAANGSYSFTLLSYSGDTQLASSAGKVYRTVQEVRVVDGAPKLVTDDGGEFGVDDVAGIR